MLRHVVRASALRVCFALALALSFASAPASSAHAVKHPRKRHASGPGADCQPYSSVPCLLPFPDDRLTREDLSTATGRRVDLPLAAMPLNRSGERIAVGEYDRADGFSPGSALIVHVPGLDNVQALARTGAAGLGELATAEGADEPVVLIDESSASRQLIWSELDLNAPSRQDTVVLIHPARGLLPGHTYVVALRDLRAANGRLLAPPGWFARLRDRRTLLPRERSQRARYGRIFAALARAQIARAGLYEAWDFTVASTASLTSRLLAIRDNAFAQLGDFDLADAVAEGQAPGYTVTSEDQIAPGLRRVQGTFAVPCYLRSCEAGSYAGFHYPSLNPDAVPTQPPAGTASPAFDCVVPTSAGAGPARFALYGHGFLATRAEVESAWVQQLAVEHDIAFCATDWWGLDASDLGFFIQSLRDVNELPVTVDRIQQGILNALCLGRLMLSPQGFAANPAFQAGGRALVDGSHLYFYGNSIGAILGGVLTAVEPDLSRAVLDVGGSDFFNLMLPRGSTFSVFGKFVLRNYRDASLHPLVLDLLQQIWERADPDGYAGQMTAQPPPRTPPHEVLMQVAYGDFQVSMYAAAYEARTIGASAYQPAVEGVRARDQQLLFGLPAISAFPFAGSAIEIWDSGAGRTQPPPLEGLPPPPEAAGNGDPHEDPRYTPAAQQQISDFLQPGGAVTDVCGSLACRTSVFMP
ncbi:MAG TPA: hypothetical protein VGX51_01360 [Solirubrobacteraceae bacterium]|nr:hypothetical protein [Solirubrobacteraceae bacterium]